MHNMSENTKMNENTNMNENIRAQKENVFAILEKQVDELIRPLGYECIRIEQTIHSGNRVLTLFIDFLENANLAHPVKYISLDDCVKVNEVVDSLFENTDLITGAYTLEVSSPGVERPLVKLQDYERFKTRKARIHTFRPLTIQELENEKYWSKNKKQKNFVGTLLGIGSENKSNNENQLKILLEVDKEILKIPFDLISKGHLEFESETHDSTQNKRNKRRE
jgi:ribosome maturation factor RimP